MNIVTEGFVYLVMAMYKISVAEDLELSMKQEILVMKSLLHVIKQVWQAQEQHGTESVTVNQEWVVAHGDGTWGN